MAATTKSPVTATPETGKRVKAELEGWRSVLGAGRRPEDGRGAMTRRYSSVRHRGASVEAGGPESS